ncbi:P2 family phage major capsid protein, partial [Yersinia enterocolitica]|nr:P2 family phage major capsid protein [Yersinia enterocolitica]
IENYESIKQDYVVEDYTCGCLVENIEILSAAKDDKTDIDRLADALMGAVNNANSPASATEGSE